MAQYALVKCNINGKDVEKIVDVRASLTDMLRNDFRLTSVKKGCEVGECGACTALIDGEAINTCLYLAVWAEGKHIITLEGLMNPDGTISDVQQAFMDETAIQCGLHARLHPDRHRDREFRQGIHRRRAPEAPLRPPVPLHGLPEHLPRRQKNHAPPPRQNRRSGKRPLKQHPRRTAPGGHFFRRAAKGSPSRGRFPLSGGNVPKGQKG